MLDARSRGAAAEAMMDHRGSFVLRLDRVWAVGCAEVAGLPERRWRRLVAHEVAALLDQLSDRFAFEESDGYLEPLVAERPELGEWVERLRDEHRAILAEIGSLAQVVPTSRAAELRARLKSLLGAIQRHEHDEIKLIQEATLTDVGVVD